MKTAEIKKRIIKSGYAAVEELIKVAEEPILSSKGKMLVDGEEIDINDSDLPADKLKNAAATKKLAIYDAFEILSRLENEEAQMNGEEKKKESFSGFAERRAK
jgi:hypothetical protein